MSVFGVFRIQSECGKIRTKKTPNTDIFHTAHVYVIVKGTCMILTRILFRKKNGLNNLNTFHPNIQFTFELEKNNPITFLDVLVTQINNNQMETRVY